MDTQSVTDPHAPHYFYQVQTGPNNLNPGLCVNGAPFSNIEACVKTANQEVAQGNTVYAFYFCDPMAQVFKQIFPKTVTVFTSELK